MSRSLVIRGGHIVDPSQSHDAVGDVLIVDGTIASIGVDLDAPDGAREVAAAGLLVTPGLIDVQADNGMPQ